jgi:hypothetical protein
MGDLGCICIILVGESERKRMLGRAKHRWEEA